MEPKQQGRSTMSTSKPDKTLPSKQVAPLRQASPYADGVDMGEVMTKKLDVLNKDAKLSKQSKAPDQKQKNTWDISNHSEAGDDDQSAYPGAVRIGPNGRQVSRMEDNWPRMPDGKSRAAASSFVSNDSTTNQLHVVPLSDVERVPDPIDQDRLEKDDKGEDRVHVNQPRQEQAVVASSSPNKIAPPVDMRMNRDGNDLEYLERDPLMCCCINCDCCRHCCPKCGAVGSTRDQIRGVVCCCMCCFMPVWLCGIDM